MQRILVGKLSDFSTFGRSVHRGRGQPELQPRSVDLIQNLADQDHAAALQPRSAQPLLPVLHGHHRPHLQLQLAEHGQAAAPGKPELPDLYQTRER